MREGGNYKDEMKNIKIQNTETLKNISSSSSSSAMKTTLAIFVSHSTKRTFSLTLIFIDTYK